MFFLPSQLGSCFISWLVPSPTLPLLRQRTDRLSYVPGPSNKHLTHAHMAHKAFLPGPLATSRWEDSSTISWFNCSNSERNTRLFTSKSSPCECWERRDLTGLLFCHYPSLSFAQSLKFKLKWMKLEFLCNEFSVLAFILYKRNNVVWTVFFSSFFHYM